MTFKYKRSEPDAALLTRRLGDFTRIPQYPPHSEIGLELELEGFGAHFMPNAVQSIAKPYWTTHNDPSLRGEACELVLRRPVSFEELRLKAIPEYVKILNDTQFKPALSNRCSLHAHLDFSNKAYYSFLRFTVLYAVYELYLFAAVGPHRRGNHFCVALDEAEAFVDRLIAGLPTADLSAAIDENTRYMAYNTQSLYKFGSVEIRLHQGVHEPDDIQRWADVLEEMLRWADTSWQETPSELIEQISMNGLENVTMTKFPRLYALIGPIFDKVLGRTGLDIAQDIAYSVEWTNAPREVPKIPEAKKSQTLSGSGTTTRPRQRRGPPEPGPHLTIGGDAALQELLHQLRPADGAPRLRMPRIRIDANPEEF